MIQIGDKKVAKIMVGNTVVFDKEKMQEWEKLPYLGEFAALGNLEYMDIVSDKRIIIRGSLPYEIAANISTSRWTEMVEFPSKYKGLSILNGQDATPNSYGSTNSAHVMIQGNRLMIKKGNSVVVSIPMSLDSIQLKYTDKED